MGGTCHKRSIPERMFLILGQRATLVVSTDELSSLANRKAANRLIRTTDPSFFILSFRVSRRG